MFKIDSNKRTCLILLLISLCWGYAPEWAAYYVSAFQKDSMQVLGHLSKFRENCNETPNKATYCSDQYRIPMSKVGSVFKNRSIGLGYLTSEMIVGCDDTFRSDSAIYLGDLQRPYRKSNIFRDYRTLNLDQLRCRDSIVIQTWARHFDVRHGLIGGSVVVGETSSIEDLKKLLEYLVNGFLVLLLILSVPLVLVFVWFRKMLDQERGVQEYDGFLLVLVFWSLSLLWISGLAQLLLPIPQLQLKLRMFANALILLSQLLMLRFCSAKMPQRKKLQNLVDFLVNPVFQIRNHYARILLSRGFIIIYFIFTFDHWSLIRTYFSIFIFSVPFLLYSFNSITVFIFSILGIAGELKILNFEYVPGSSTKEVFISLVFMTELFLVVKAEISETLFNYIRTLTHDRRLSAELVHDIRSPLMVLKLLIDRVEWPKEQGEVREVVLASINQIGNISKSVLKNSERRIIFSGTDQVESAAHAVQIEFQDSGAKLLKKIDMDCLFKIDATILYRIAQNLIRNAFQVPNVKNIGLTIEKVNDSTSRFRVENDGVLPTQKILEKILKERGTYGKSYGTGLGLDFCKEEIRKAGGSFSMAIDGDRIVVDVII